MNARLGERTDEYIEGDQQFGEWNAIGKFGHGSRNENGELLLQFLLTNKLFAVNTIFQHLKRHQTTWTTYIKSKNTMYKCKKCSFFSKFKCYLKQHTKTMHKKIKYFKCTECDFTTRDALQLKLHIKEVHTKIKVYKCEMC